MDPNLFHVDWERTLEALVTIIVLAFFVERAGALLFESRLWIYLFEERRVTPPGGPRKRAGTAPGAAFQGVAVLPLKEAIVFVVSLLMCRIWQFDAISLVILSDKPHTYGYLVTAAVIAGGSKAAIKLFKDVMGIRSSAEAERAQIRREDRIREAAEAQATLPATAPPVTPPEAS